MEQCTYPGHCSTHLCYRLDFDQTYPMCCNADAPWNTWNLPLRIFLAANKFQPVWMQDYPHIQNKAFAGVKCMQLQRSTRQYHAPMLWVGTSSCKSSCSKYGDCSTIAQPQMCKSRLEASQMPCCAAMSSCLELQCQAVKQRQAVRCHDVELF